MKVAPKMFVTVLNDSVFLTCIREIHNLIALFALPLTCCMAMLFMHNKFKQNG